MRACVPRVCVCAACILEACGVPVPVPVPVPVHACAGGGGGCGLRAVRRARVPAVDLTPALARTRACSRPQVGMQNRGMQGPGAGFNSFAGMPGMPQQQPQSNGWQQGHEGVPVGQGHHKYRTKPCRYFNMPSGCKNGDGCNFLHQIVGPDYVFDTPGQYQNKGKGGGGYDGGGGKGGGKGGGAFNGYHSQGQAGGY